MAYVVPSVLVYQQLKNAGGVLNSTPDLECCIFGPANNVVTFDVNDPVSLAKTAAATSISALGTVSLGSTSVTFNNVTGFTVGDNITIAGAGADGALLQTTITAINGLVVTVGTAASTAVTGAVVSKSAYFNNPVVDTTYLMPSAKPGQVVDVDSINLYFTNAKVESFTANGYGKVLANMTLDPLGTAKIVMEPQTYGNAGYTGSGAYITVDNPSYFKVDDYILIKGGGPQIGATGVFKDLVTRVVGFNESSDSTNCTLSIYPSLGVGNNLSSTTPKISKVYESNFNADANSLRVEAGDAVTVSYTNAGGSVVVLNTNARSVETDDGQVGRVTTITLADAMANMKPVGLFNGSSVTVTGTPTRTVKVSSGDYALISVGSSVVIDGCGLNKVRRTVIAKTTSGPDYRLHLDQTVTWTSSGNPTIDVIPTVSFEVVKNIVSVALPAVDPKTSQEYFEYNPVDQELVLHPNPVSSYGRILEGNVHVEYTALRKDLSGRLLSFDSLDDIEALLEDTTDSNPLGLACVLAKANTTGRVNAVAVDGDTLEDYLAGLEASENYRLYVLAPLTQNQSILSAFKAHVESMSLPENASWRTAIVNTELPTTINVGVGATLVVTTDSYGSENAVGQGFTSSSPSGDTYFQAPAATFVTDGVAPGDILSLVVDNYNLPDTFEQFVIAEIIDNTKLIVEGDHLNVVVNSYQVKRTLSKAQQAASVAAVSRTYGSKRVWHLMPSTVGVSVGGVTKYLPGYYAAAAMAGLVSGVPVQMNLTNIGLAGITDLRFASFYFSKKDLGTMAEAGTMLLVQDVQGGVPYVRHSLTTDVSVLAYREVLKVKNIDFLSYFYYDKLRPFIGTWNITEDTLNIMRQTLTASGELLKSKKLPKIGAPLISYKIEKIAQNEFNKDSIDVIMPVSVVDPNNYTNLYLVI